MALDAALRAGKKAKPKKTYAVKPKSRGPQGLPGPRQSTTGRARQVTPRNPAPAFRPLASQVKPFAGAQSKQKKQSVAAQKRVPADPRLRRVPIYGVNKKSKPSHSRGPQGLPGPHLTREPTAQEVATQIATGLKSPLYSSAQRRSIYASLRKARGKRSVRDYYNSSNREERHYLAQLGKALNTTQRSKSHADAKPDHHGMKFTGETKLAGFIPVPGLHQLGWTVDQALRNLARPANAVTSAAYAAQEHRSPLKGAAEGFTGKRVKTGSDLLKKHGMHGAPAAILGTLGDIVVDPLNAASFGTGSAAEHFVTQGRRLLHHAGELTDAGRHAEAAEVTAKANKLLEKAAHAPTNKGIKVGVRLGQHSVTTSGALSAKALKLAGVSKGTTALRETRGVQALGKALAPDFRPAGVNPQEWQAYRASLRESRAGANLGHQYWERRGRAYAKALRKKDKGAHKQIVDALERARIAGVEHRVGEVPTMPKEASIHGLPEDLKPVAIAARKDLKTIGDAAFDAGLLPKGRTRNYFPHQWTRAARKQLKKAERTGGKRNPYSISRQDQRPITEQHADLPDGMPPKFDYDVARVIANRGGKHAEQMAQRQLESSVVRDIGRPLDKLEDLRPGDHVYVAGRGLKSIGTKADYGNLSRASDALQAGERFVVLPKVIGDAVTKGISVKPAGGDILHGYDKVMNGIKTVLTVLNVPAYDLRNLSGDLFLARQADTDPKSLLDGFRIIGSRSKRNVSQERNLKDAFDPDAAVNLGRGIKMTRGELLDEMEKHGAIGTGFHGNELQQFESIAPSRRGLLKQTRRLSGVREDSVRAGTYLSARRRGMTPAEAAEWTNKHHFDYSDLTQAERDVLRRIFPFWTFTARNTRLQAEKLVTRPARAANYGLAMDEGRKQAGLPEGYQSKLPGYYRRGLGIPAKIGGERKLLFPQLPITDLNRLAALSNPREEFQETLQMVNPVAKWFYEPLQNHSLFFRQPIYQDADHKDAPHYVPAPGWLDFVDKHLVPGDLRKTLAGGNEDAAKQGLWTSKADYAFRLTPQQNTLTQVTTAKTGSRSQDRKDALLSQLTGVKINQYDGLKYRIDKLYEARDKVDRRMADMRHLKITHRHEYNVLKDERKRLEGLIAKSRVKHGDIPKPKPKAKSHFGSTSSGSGHFGASPTSGGKHFGAGS